MKYNAHPSIIAAKQNYTSKSNFDFSFIEKDILEEIKTLLSNKATQNTGIPTKLIKADADISAEFIFISLNKCIEQSVFLSKLKLANITLVHKKPQKAQNKITDLSVFCQLFLKCMRSSCLNKYLNILNLFYRISVWIQEGIQRPTLSIVNVRKMETRYW